MIFRLATTYLLVLTLSGYLTVNEIECAKTAIEVSKYAKYYDRINDHLIEEVNSDDVELNMEEARRWSKKKQFFSSKSMSTALKQFLELPEAISSTSKCERWGLDIIQNNNDALNNQLRLEEHNYSLQRIDRIVEYYSYQFALLCSGYMRQLNYHSLGYGLKSAAYKRIDSLLLAENAKDKTTDEIMELIKKHLIQWKQENPTGALTEAAEQIVELETVLGENKCSSKSRDILYRNELAADLTRYLWLPVLSVYIKRQAAICLDIYPGKLNKALAKFDESTKRSLAILISEYYFRNDIFLKFGQSIEHSKYSQINDDLTTPEVVQLMSKVVDQFKQDSSIEIMQLQNKQGITRHFIHDSLELILTKSNPDYKYLFSTRDQKGNKIIDEDKVAQIYEKYIVEPCKKYKQAVDKEIILPSRMNNVRIDTNSKIHIDKFMDKLGFALGQSLSTVCRDILNDGERGGRDVVYYIRSYA